MYPFTGLLIDEDEKKQAKITDSPVTSTTFPPSPPQVNLCPESFADRGHILHVCHSERQRPRAPATINISSFNSACKGPASRNSGNHADRGGSDNWSCSTVGTRPRRRGRSTSGRLLGSYPGLCGWERKMQGQYIYLFHMVVGNRLGFCLGDGAKGRGGFLVGIF